MKRYLALVIAGTLAGTVAVAQDMKQAQGTFMDADGNELGTVTLMETAHGTLVDIDVENVPAGEHGFHLHETGKCDAPDFKSAGGHFNPTGNEHGYKAEGGAHSGDLPNQFVQDDGVMRAQVLKPDISMTEGEDGYVFDEDGTAVIIHAGADDYESQPSGDAGGRFACAVLESQ